MRGGREGGGEREKERERKRERERERERDGEVEIVHYTLTIESDNVRVVHHGHCICFS